MKILMLTSNMVGRGTYLRVIKFASELARRGHDVTILATKKNGCFGISEYYEQSVKIVEFPDFFPGSLRSGWDPYNVIRRITWLLNMQFDIVHAFESRPTVIYPALFMKCKGSILITDWCDWFGRGGAVEERPNPIIRSVLRPVETYFEEHFRNQAKYTTVICSTLFDRALKLGQPSERVFLLPNGFDMPELKQYDRNETRKLLGLSIDDFVIGYVGAGFQQDIKLMEHTFNLIVRKIPTVKLIHIGRSNYTISSEAMKSEKIIQTGDISNELFNYYLSACDICWLPLKNTQANRGRFPLKLTTYLAVGRPVVATAVGDLVPIFDQFNIGLMSLDNPEAIAEKIFALYNSPKLLLEQSKNARDLGKNEEYSWKKRGTELEGIYTKALTEARVTR